MDYVLFFVLSASALPRGTYFWLRARIDFIFCFKMVIPQRRRARGEIKVQNIVRLLLIFPRLRVAALELILFRILCEFH